MSEKIETTNISNNTDLININNYEYNHVHKVYNNIAQHFSLTRHKPWPQVKEFLINLDKYSIIIDVGCGNGKNLGLSNGYNIGCDYCCGLLNIAKSSGHEVIRCDALALPYKNSCADAVICIAVIHHFATFERRLQAVYEIIRILKQGGLALIYVWAGDGDKFVKWNNSDDNKRYYHFFTEQELISLCSHEMISSLCAIRCIYSDKENWAIVLEKL